MRPEGVEPSRPRAQDPKSCVSTSSTTVAWRSQAAVLSHPELACRLVPQMVHHGRCFGKSIQPDVPSGTRLPARSSNGPPRSLELRWRTGRKGGHGGRFASTLQGGCPPSVSPSVRQHVSTSARQHASTPARQHASTPARQHASTPARQHASTPARQHARDSLTTCKPPVSGYRPGPTKTLGCLRLTGFALAKLPLDRELRYR